MDNQPTLQVGGSNKQEDDAKGLLATTNLVDMLQDIQLQPEWRSLADKCADYYDSNQLSAQDLEDIQAKGLPPLVVNLIKPTIDVVLGMEEKTRTDWRVSVESVDEEGSDDLSDALSAKLHEVEAESRADRACSEAYAAQVKAGLGWVEVSRETNPFKPSPYRVKYVHRREIDWDWRAREFDLSDARFLVRRKWYDNDVLTAMFQEKADLIKSITGGWNLWDNRLMSSNLDTGLQQSYDIERGSNMEDAEWRDMGRKRSCLFEAWYRIYQPVHIMKVGGRVVEFDLANPMHCQAVQQGLVKLDSAVVDRVRQSYWVGPHRLVDRHSPYKHNKFPYIPFFGFREDLTGIPYGLIRSMISSQDEVNARRAKMYWLLSTRRIIADADAVLDHRLAGNEVARADAYIQLNDKRKDRSQFLVQENQTIAKDQFEVMENAADNIQKTAGVYQAMLGADAKAQSGLAINARIDQGTTTLGEINGNYRDARIEVGDLLLELLKEDIAAKAMAVPIGESKTRKIVNLNEPAQVQGMEGLPTLKNDVQRAVAKVTLDNVPASATYRQQLSAQLIEMTKALPPNIQGLVLDFVIEGSDLPKRHEIADRIRKALGLTSAGEDGQPTGPTENEQVMAQQMEEMKAQAQEMIGKLQAEVQKYKDALMREQGTNMAHKRAIAEISLEDKQMQVAASQAEREREANAQDEEDNGAAIVGAKLDMIAEQVGRLTQMVEQVKGAAQ